MVNNKNNSSGSKFGRNHKLRGDGSRLSPVCTNNPNITFEYLGDSCIATLSCKNSEDIVIEKQIGNGIEVEGAIIECMMILELLSKLKSYNRVIVRGCKMLQKLGAIIRNTVPNPSIRSVMSNKLLEIIDLNQ